MSILVYIFCAQNGLKWILNTTLKIITFCQIRPEKSQVKEACPQPYAFLNLKSLPGMAAEEAAMFYFTPCFELV